MKAARLFAFLASLTSMICPVAAQAGVLDSLPPPRLALVIGNGSYAGMPVLRNPANDAADIAAALRSLGFSATLLIDANRKTINQAIVSFRESLAQDRRSEGLFYFAGHGIQSKGVNYIIPVGADIRSEADLEDEAIGSQRVLSSLDEARNRVNLVVFDACRDNPLPAWFRGASRGLTVVGAAPPETVVLYSTGAGQTAADGSGRNSPFAEALLAHLGDEGDIMTTVKAVTRDVKAFTDGAQVPYLYSSLTQDFELNARAGPAEARATSPAAAPRPVPVAPRAQLPGDAVAKTSVKLEGGKEIARIMGTNLGRLVAAGMKAAAGADIALMNGGGIRDSIPEGFITPSQIASVLPFGNRIVSTLVTGEELRAILENGVSKLPAADGRFPHLAGVSFSYDISRPAGSRVAEILVVGEPSSPTAKYRLATVDYVANGGDGYSTLAGKRTEDFGPDAEAFTLYLSRLGVITEATAAEAPAGPAATSASSGLAMSVAKLSGAVALSARTAGVLSVDGKDIGNLAGNARARLDGIEVGMHRIAIRYADGTEESRTLFVDRDREYPLEFLFVAARNQSGAIEYLLPGSSSIAPLRLERRSIGMAGKEAEWAGLEPIWDEMSGGRSLLGKKGYEFLRGYACRDDANLYWRVDFSAANPLDQPPAGSYAYAVLQVQIQYGPSENLEINLRLNRRSGRAEILLGTYSSDTKEWKELGRTSSGFKSSRSAIELRVPYKEIGAYLGQPRAVRLRMAAADQDGAWMSGNVDSPSRYVDFR